MQLACQVPSLEGIDKRKISVLCSAQQERLKKRSIDCASNDICVF